MERTGFARFLHPKEGLMAETVAQFDTPIPDRLGGMYQAKACGRVRDDGLWEGWIEFEDSATGSVLRSQRETTQPNLTDLKYWATGLTPVYLEGALDRIQKPAADGAEPNRVAGHSKVNLRSAILDPFSVYEHNPEQLAQELKALRGYHLRQIIRDYDLADERDPLLESLSEPELGSLIMRRMRELHP
jgi:hypothetical protein